MKVRDTSPGRLYALSSEIGCTAINGAMAVDIPAGGQVVVLALAKKIVIDGDDAAKFVEVRWGTNTVVGSRPAPAWLSDVLSGLISIVGDDNFDINYIPAENKLYLQFSLDVTTEQIEEVRSLLARVLPKDFVVVMEWADGLPMTYTRLEYLESTGTQWIDTGYIPDINTSAVCTAMPLEKELVFRVLFGTRQGYLNQTFTCFSNQTTIFPTVSSRRGSSDVVWEEDCFGQITIYSITPSAAILNDLPKQWGNQHSFEKAPAPLVLGAGRSGGSIIYPFVGRIYSAKISQGAEIVRNLIPCLDATGTPCMFDTVSRTPFRNDGSGDFIIGIETQQQLDNMLDSFPNYTGQAIEKLQINLAEALQTPENEARLAEAMAQNSTMPAMLSLDGEFVAPRLYAQLTEHGIRRLYYVPKGYAVTMDEYAATNGFKELVEPPMPMTGHWMPEWRETDTQIILDWVETEPPTEEETPIEDTENA